MLDEALSRRRRSLDCESCVCVDGIDVDNGLMVVGLVLMFVLALSVEVVLVGGGGGGGRDGGGAKMSSPPMRVVAVREVVSVTSSERARMRWGTME